MKNLVIVGSGAVAAEITSYIEDQNKNAGADERFNILGYLDSKENSSTYWAKYKFKKPVLDEIDAYVIKEDDHFIVAIANIRFRQSMIDLLRSKNATIVGFVHASAIISDTAILGSGNIVYPYCIIGPNAVLGNHNLITSYSFISHDCRVGDNNFFSTAGLSGNSSVGNRNYFGIRATVLPGVSIGDDNVIQAGMVVDKSVSNDSTVFHRFREKVIAIHNSGDHGQ